MARLPKRVEVTVPEDLYQSAEQRAKGTPYDAEDFLKDELDVTFDFVVAE